jgi:hypothetical protein
MVLNDIFINVIRGIEPSKEDYDTIKRIVKSKGKIKLEVFGLHPENIYKWIRIIDLVDDYQYLWKLEAEDILKIERI